MKGFGQIDQSGHLLVALSISNGLWKSSQGILFLSYTAQFKSFLLVQLRCCVRKHLHFELGQVSLFFSCRQQVENNSKPRYLCTK